MQMSVPSGTSGCIACHFLLGYYVFTCLWFLFRNVLPVTTEIAVALSWAAVCPVSATACPMSAKSGRGGAW